MLFGVDESTWFAQLKEAGGSLGFATSNKDYKANPDAYKGSLSDMSEIIRVALVGSTQSPNLHEIVEILGQEAVSRRLGHVAGKLN